MNLEEIVIQMEDETGVKRSQNSIRTITQRRKMKIPVERDFDVIIDYVRDHYLTETASETPYRDWETDRKSTRLNSSHRSLSRMPSSA